MTEKEISVYIHIPYCPAKCLYCDFLSFPLCSAPAVPAAYIKALTREIFLWGRKLESLDIRVSTLYIGGGTPTALSASELSEVLAACRRYLPLAEPEWTVEVNPGTLTPEKIEEMVKAGVNRASIGVQDLNEERLVLLGRQHNPAQAEEAFLVCRDAFPAVSVDVMAALPGQEPADLQETLAAVCGWGARHISVYGLAVAEGTPLFKLVKEDRVALPDEEAQLEMFTLTREYLLPRNYEHYEIASYTKGQHCRHNLTYWKNLPYAGIGLGAHSYWQKMRLANTRQMEVYLQSLAEDRLPVAECHNVSRREEMEDTIILGLRLRDGVSLSDFAGRFKRDLREVFAAEIKWLSELQLLECRDGFLRLTDKGLPLANTVFAEFISC